MSDVLFLSFLPLLIVSLLAARPPFNEYVIAGSVANFLAYLFAFLYNDIEDRVEDAQSPRKRFKNPFGYGVWPLWYGYAVMAVIIVVSLALSYLGGGLLLAGIMASNLAVGLLYSSKPIRLKGLPMMDILSHAYLLAGVTVLYFMYIEGATRDTWTWLLLAGAMLISAAGDARNEYRDYEDDMEAGLKNTARFLGKQNMNLLMMAFYGAGTLSIVVGAIGAVSTLS